MDTGKVSGGTAAAFTRLDDMREAVALTAIGSVTLLTLTVAGTAMVRNAAELSSRQRLQLDASIDQIVMEQVARRDDIPASAETARGAVTNDVTELRPGTEARKEAARQNRDPEERAEREARAATARPAKKRRAQIVTFRPDRVLPQAFLSIRKLTFDVLR